MQDVFYSQKKLKNMKLMKVESNEPCSVDVWLKLIKSKENIPDDFKSKQRILERYPEVYEIILKTYIYNYDFKKNITKQKITVIEKSPEKIIKSEKQNNPDKSDESNNTRRNSKFQNSKFSKFSSDSDSKGGFKIYKAKQFKSMNVSNSFESSNKSSFNNRNGRTHRQQISPMYSIVIKNLPNDYNANDLRNELQYVFCDYIESKFNCDKRICKTSVLTSNNVVKGVAFIDFYNKEHMESIMSSTERFKIGFNILNIEKKNKN